MDHSLPPPNSVFIRSGDDEQIMETKFEDEDIFIDVRLQETLAALDKDLAGRLHLNLNAYGAKRIKVRSQ